MLAAVAAGTALAFALTWVWSPSGGSGDLSRAPRIQTRALRDAPLPATAPVTGSTGSIQGDPGDAAAVAGLPLYAWYAHQRQGDGTQAAVPQDTAPETPENGLETTDVP